MVKPTTQEKYIENFLIKNNIQYKSQFSFDDCKFKNVLKFDFAVFENNKLKCVIEYDGIRHQQRINGSYDSFNTTLWRDKTKNDYCEKHLIPLLRISYPIEKESEICFILENHLIKNYPIITNEIMLDDFEEEIIPIDFFERYEIDYIIEEYINGKLEDLLDEYDNYLEDVN